MYKIKKQPDYNYSDFFSRKTFKKKTLKCIYHIHINEATLAFYKF